MRDWDETAVLGLAVVFALCFTICFCMQLHNVKTIKFIESGYTRTTLPGSDYATWVKN